MPKRIALWAAVAALAVSPAVAQQTTPSPSQPSPQAQPSQAAPQAQAKQPGADKPFLETQARDQLSASDLIGLRVKGPGDENIGSINDLIVEKDGTIVAAVVGVGGFLGIGEKDVAVNFDSLNVTRNADGEQAASLKITKAELENAPTFKPFEAPRSAAQRPSPGAPGGGGGSKPGGM